MSKVIKFFTILKAELEDLEDDLESLIREQERRRQEDICTEYVERENCALYRDEIASIREFMKTVSEHERKGNATLSDTRVALLEAITKKVQDGAYPELLNEILRRRIDKVSGYVEFS